MSEGGPGGAAAPAPPGSWLESMLPLRLADAASAGIELGCVFGPVAVLFAPAPGLWAVLAGLLLLATVAWARLAGRLWAPLRAARAASLLPAERRGVAPPAGQVAPAAYLAGTRLGFVSLWLRTALVTAVAALWGGLGVSFFHLPPEGLLLALWAAALAVPHLGSWRALLWQRRGNRWLLQLLRSPAAAAWARGSDPELRLLRDTFQGRLVLSALACSGVFGSGAVCIVATSTVLPVRGQLELWWWLPPALLLATLAWLAWLRLRTRPIDRFLDSELGDEIAAALPRPGPAGRARELAQALRATQQLPYALAVALWLAWTGSALLAVLAARSRFALRPTGVLQLLVPVALLMFAAAMYQVPYQQAILAPLWPRLTARALQAPGRTPAVSGSLPLLLVVPVALLMLLWELLLGFGGGGQSWQSWLSGAVLIAVAVGGTWLLLRDLVRPLRALRRRAAWLAGGEFAPRGDGSAGPFSEGLGGLGASLELGARRLVAAGGEQLLIADIDSEGDEVGRLAAALTAMQRALGERLLSSAHAQLLLEQQVSARTVELQRRNEELRGALANLQRTQDALLHTEHLASVGRLVAGIAHEINNPINAVVNMAAPLREALLELAAPARSAAVAAETLRELPDMLRVIERGTRRTAEIVRALHSYADREPTAFALVDVHQILAEALELLPHPATAGVTITRRFGELPHVFAHPGQLQQVFINLLSNAFHAVSARAAGAAGGYVPQLELQTRLDERWVRVAVRDNGTGIPPEVRLRIFDPFFTTKDASSGSGLGLSIAHGIVSRHGGTIAVDTAVGQGACFTVSLPAADPAVAGRAPEARLGPAC